MNKFLENLARVELIDHRGYQILAAANITSADRLYSLIQGFPSLSEYVNYQRLSAYALNQSSFAAVSGTSAFQRLVGAPKRYARGALEPPNAKFRTGHAVPLLPAGSSVGSNGIVPLPTVKIRLPDAHWDVYDQGDRGTCVAFALASAREWLARVHEAHERTLRLSAQFLFWAAKQYDVSPMDGTRIEYGSTALRKRGVCREVHWPYEGNPWPGSVTQESPGVPSPAATSDAQQFQHHASSTLTPRQVAPSGNAQLVIDALQAGRPAVISLPMFSDPGGVGFTNWNLASGEENGEVLDPPPLALARGGHAVCIVGFVPDANERLGGYFEFRNSWGTDWGKNVRPRGYGTVSASYVDEYLWEMCVL